MKLMVNHQTHYVYSSPVQKSIQYIRMMPVDSAHQKVQMWHISVPGGKELKHDAYSNVWLTSNQRQPYERMTIMAQGIVEINLSQQEGKIDHLNPYIFLQPTVSTGCNEKMRVFADSYAAARTRSSLIDMAQALLERVPYVPAQTCVNTSAIQAFERGQGVCQDHTHIFIALCKYLGLPARYVSGYLYAQDITHLASHAWAEVFVDNAWYCFDVSNQLFTPESHIYVAIGRDYWDVAPVRGVRENGGEESMSSLVQVLSY
jgi:transglutaminase-like putative cysteine protease